MALEIGNCLTMSRGSKQNQALQYSSPWFKLPVVNIDSAEVTSTMSSSVSRPNISQRQLFKINHTGTSKQVVYIRVLTAQRQLKHRHILQFNLNDDDVHHPLPRMNPNPNKKEGRPRRMRDATLDIANISRQIKVQTGRNHQFSSHPIALSNIYTPQPPCKQIPNNKTTTCHPYSRTNAAMVSPDLPLRNVGIIALECVCVCVYVCVVRK